MKNTFPVDKITELLFYIDVENPNNENNQIYLNKICEELQTIENMISKQNQRKNASVHIHPLLKETYFDFKSNEIHIGILGKDAVDIECSLFHEITHANQHFSNTISNNLFLLNKILNYNYVENGLSYYCNPLEIEARLIEVKTIIFRFQNLIYNNTDKLLYKRQIKSHLNELLDIIDKMTIKNIFKTKLFLSKIENEHDFKDKTGITTQDAKRFLNSTFVNKYYIKLYIDIKSAKKQIKNILNQINKADINKLTENEILQKSKRFSEDIDLANEYLKQKQIELSTADKIDNTQAYGKIFVSGKDELVQKIEELQKDNPDIFIKVIDMDVIKSFDKSNDYTILYFKSKNGLDVEENVSGKPEHIECFDEQER